MSDNPNPNNDSLQDDIDPEIAELIGAENADSAEDQPDFGALFGEKNESSDSQSEEVDLTKKTFPAITKREEAAKPFFTDKNYYKIALGGEGEASQRLHEILSKFLSTQDPQERSMHRGKLISCFWNLAEKIAIKSASDLPIPKKLSLRFGALLPTLISSDQRIMLSKVIFDNNTGEPVHYVDEWLRQIATGQVSQSATDEVKVKKKDDNSVVVAQMEKMQGQKDVHLNVLTTKLSEMDSLENQLVQKLNTLMRRDSSPTHGGLKLGYNEQQRSSFTEIGNLMRQLGSIDKEVGRIYGQLDNATDSLETLKDKASESGHVSMVDGKVVTNEFNTVRQMSKLCVGRQGNHQPILMKQYFRSNILDIGTRENVIVELAAIEAIDTDLFSRTFKSQTNRIVPHIILVPCYGDAGTCWEPFEKYNRATSRGRVAIPMFPKDIKTAVIAAMADLRWQVAKEKAQHYWMEEGLTGGYFQWFDRQKRRGDVREAFIQDYILWITKESEGTQKLDKDVRPVFWRYVPFPQELKESLKNRGFVFSELYKKDKNREMSDGY